MNRLSSFRPLCAALLAAGLSFQNGFAREIYVSPGGKKDGAGTEAEPVSFDAAIGLASQYMKSGERPEQGKLEIIIGGGRYPITRRHVLGEEFRGSETFPITIRAAEGEKVIFDGQAAAQNPQDFAPVTDEGELARLAPAARDKVRVKTITNEQLIRALSGRVQSTLVIDGKPYLPSVFPNSGYAKLSRDPVVPEVCPPGIPKEQQQYRVRAGRAQHEEPGRKRGWRGSLEEPRGAQAQMLTRADEMAGSWEQWQAAIERDPSRADFSGFYEAIWKESTMKIVSVNPDAQTLHLEKAFSYGFGWLKHQPFRVFGLLCEVDQPGEWHFDLQTNRLFLIPVKPITKDTQISAAVADGFLEIKGTTHVTIAGLTVENVGRGQVIGIGGAHNRLLGCTIRSSTARGVGISGRDNEVRDCDFIDLYAHVSLSGGRRSADKIVAGRNLVENCHFYHENFTHRKVNISIGGVGQTFRHNLIHNSIGQAVMVRGNDHLIELNELFNIGYEEGDGAAIYAGADMTGYGTVYRHNFFHHLMRTPDKKLGRAGIMMDDHQAGATIEGNIFYKSTDVAVQLNCGAGHTVRGNTFVEGKQGILTLGGWGPVSFGITEEIRKDPKHKYRGEKEDYVGKVVRLLGEDGWNKEPWASRYPLMRRVLNDAGEYGRMWPIYSSYTDNIYSQNRQNKAIISGLTDELKAKMELEGDRVVEKDAFVDYDNMDFRLRERVDASTALPFEKMGLYRSEYRPSVPDPSSYRMAIKRHYDGQKSYVPYKSQFDSAAAVKAAMR